MSIETRTSIFSASVVTFILLIKALRKNLGLSVEDVSKRHFDLGNSCPKWKIERVAMRRTPSGVHSDDVDSHFGWICQGYATESDLKIKLNKEGIRLALDAIREEFQKNPRTFSIVAAFLGFGVEDVLFALNQIKP